jgi:ATP-dependent Clp protease ATP-binding subunit ClpA
LREAVGRGDARLDCEHVLLALLHEPGGRAQRLVMRLGRSPRAVEMRLKRALKAAPPAVTPAAEPGAVGGAS